MYDGLRTKGLRFHFNNEEVIFKDTITETKDDTKVIEGAAEAITTTFNIPLKVSFLNKLKIRSIFCNTNIIIELVKHICDRIKRAFK